jgi:ABC-type branched-subunit amino acid transport system ATPase component/branched-subunit amino acid ABC-type transport system permease component
MQEFLNLLLNGAVSGAIYSLIASGLVLSYTATGIFNLSYAGTAFTAAFVYYELHSDDGQGWPVWLAAPLVILVFCPLLGLALDAAVFRPLASASDAAKIMATVGLLVALPELALWIVEKMITVFHWDIPDGSQVFTPPAIGPSPKETWHPLDGVNVDSNQLVVFGAAVLCAVALWYLMRRTPVGLRMRAVVDRPELAELRGVDRRQTSRLAWVIGSTLAGLAGVIGAPIINALVPGRYTSMMIIACAAAVLGGLRSIPLAFIGGLVVGITANLVQGYADFADNVQGLQSNAPPFILLLGGLVWLGRDRSRRAGAVAADVPPPDHLADLPAWRRRLPWALGTAFLLFVIFVWADSFWLGNITEGLAFGLIFLSFIVLTGMGGMVSLAQATFVTAAALSAGVAMSRYDLPWIVALLIGVGVSVIVGTVVALPALRLGGLPLALATLALALLGQEVLFKWNYLRNGSRGWTIEQPTFGPFELSDRRTMAVLLLIVTLLAILMIHNLRNSSTGRAIDAVRSAEPAAATSGIAPVVIKLKLFALSSGLAGLGGVLLVTLRGSANEVTTPALLGLLWLAQVVLFGIRRPGGAVIAGISSICFAAALKTGFHHDVLPSFLQWDGNDSIHLSPILFGMGAIQLARSPDGILALTGAQNAERRRRRADARAARQVTGTLDEAPPETRLAAVATHTPSHEAAAQTIAETGLQLQGVRSGYGEIEVLHGIDLVVRPGTITALLGANGAGKTTLCRTAAGALAATAGEILRDGQSITALGATRRARAGLLLAPESRGVFPGLSVRENLQLRLSAAEREEAYRRFPILGERRSLPAGSLSGGEQQMLTLAPLLVQPPEVLIADEPSLGLAPLIVAQIMGLFGELRDRGVAILLVEEKARDVLAIADTVAFLELGRITWTGPRDEVDEDRLAAAYLGA